MSLRESVTWSSQNFSLTAIHGRQEREGKLFIEPLADKCLRREIQSIVA